ncbi:hypothetical protein [Streptomyces sp. NBC_00503]|nr:hypothetical protein [Streptomyces sp. NBC_00503]WUD85740.1 hypothetical protein OG490_37190 [Streptomyces sp. NBC_00503]
MVPLNSWQTKPTATHAPGAVVLIRRHVGAVFLFEGTQKFL